jgi:hypothetical protein
MDKKLLGALGAVGIAVVGFALGNASDKAATTRVLSGRTEHDRPFVTELDAGRFRWFDTMLYAPCISTRHYDFVWTETTNRVPFKWDGRHLTVRAEGVPSVGDHYTARLDGTYDSETGLRGTMQVEVQWEGETCRSGPVKFWAVADR